jgi:hypothetical protein
VLLYVSASSCVTPVAVAWLVPGSLVVTAAGQSSVPFAFVYNDLVRLPAVDGVVPIAGPPAGGAVVRILGVRFRGSVDVLFLELSTGASVRTGVQRRCDIVSQSETEIR